MTENVEYITKSDLAKVTGSKESTIKYYSDLGLIPHKQADKKSRKYYSRKDASERITEIEKLKKSGLSINQIVTYFKSKNTLNQKHMAKVITVSVRKGGVGKTTTAINLATALHLRGKRVLLIDLDSQANATIAVGINPMELDMSIHSLFTDTEIAPRDVIMQTEFGLSIMPAKEELRNTEIGMTATQVGALKPIIETLKNDFDYIVIDTAPNGGYLAINALVASNSVIIPLEAHYLAMQGLGQSLDDIRKVKNGLNSKLEIIGILPTKVNANTNIAKTVLENVENNYPDLLLPYRIKFSIRLSESNLAGKPVVIYDPQHETSQEYFKLADYIDGKKSS